MHSVWKRCANGKYIRKLIKVKANRKYIWSLQNYILVDKFVTIELFLCLLKNFSWYKSALSGLRQYVLATESSLKMMKNVFYFTLKALFVLKIFKFVFWLFGHEEKQLD